MEQMRIDRRVVMTKRFLKGSLIEILKKKEHSRNNNKRDLRKSRCQQNNIL